MMMIRPALVLLVLAACSPGVYVKTPSVEVQSKPPAVVAIYEVKLQRMSAMCSSLPNNGHQYELAQVNFQPGPTDKNFVPMFICQADGQHDVWIDIPKDILP